MNTAEPANEGGTSAGRRRTSGRRELHPKTAARATIDVVREAAKGFADDDCPGLAAGLAFYTLFSLAPLLVLVTRGAGLFLGTASVEQEALAQIERFVGPAGREQAAALVDAFQIAAAEGGFLATAISVVVAVMGATTVLAQIQLALNRAFNTEPSKSIVAFLLRRAVSLGLVVALAIALVVSAVSSATLATLQQVAAVWLPPILAGPAFWSLDLVMEWLTLTVLIGAVFKWLPDRHVHWEPALVGSLLTSALFVIGNQAIAAYFGIAAAGSVYGAAGSLAVVLMWVYYSSLILLFGAELTQAIAYRYRPSSRPGPRTDTR